MVKLHCDLIEEVSEQHIVTWFVSYSAVEVDGLFFPQIVTRQGNHGYPQITRYSDGLELEGVALAAAFWLAKEQTEMLKQTTEKFCASYGRVVNAGQKVFHFRDG